MDSVQENGKDLQQEKSSNTWDQYSKKQKWAILLCIIIGTMAFWMDRYSVNVILPKIAGALDGMALYSWVPTAYMLGAAIAAPIWGKLSDIFGRRTIYLWMLSLVLLGFIGCAAAQSYTFVIFARTVTGIGIGGIQGLNFTLIGTFFAPDERGKNAGVMGFVLGFCAMGAPVISAAINDNFGWRYSMLLMVPVCLAGIICCIKFLPNLRVNSVAKKLDYVGMVLLAFVAVPFVLAFSWAGSTYPWTSPIIIGLFLFSVAVFIIFYNYEKRIPGYSLIPVELFTNRSYMFTAMVSIFMAFSMTGVTTYLSLFCQGVQGMSPTVYSTIGIPAYIVTIFTGWIAGSLIDKTKHYKWLLIMAPTSGVIVCFTISKLTAAVAIVTLMGIRVFQQLFGAGFMPVINPLAAMAPLKQEQHAIGVGTINFMSSLGNSLAPAILGSALNAAYANYLVKNTAAIASGLNPAQLNTIKTSRILVNGPAMKAFESTFGGNTELFKQTVEAVRTTLHQAVSTTFLVAAGCVCISVLFAILVKEAPIPSRKKPDVKPAAKNVTA